MFELSDQHTQARRCDEQCFRGTGEVVMLGREEKRAQLARVDIHIDEYSPIREYFEILS